MDGKLECRYRHELFNSKHGRFGQNPANVDCFNAIYTETRATINLRSTSRKYGLPSIKTKQDFIKKMKGNLTNLSMENVQRYMNNKMQSKTIQFWNKLFKLKIHNKKVE